MRVSAPAASLRLLDWLSLPLLVVIWQVAAMVVQSRFLPTPLAVAGHIVTLTTTGHLLEDFSQTLLRALIGFVVAMVVGTGIGLLLGRYRVADHLFGNWVVVGLNMPAIVLAIMFYIWLGLTDFALVLAVVVNKVPLVVTTVREGVRSFLPEYDELADAFRMPPARRFRLIFVPQLLPFILAAGRTGLALVWKIVLVFEVLGSDGGAGFRISIFFQYFDMQGILSYTMVFIAVVMTLEYGVLRPLERRVLKRRMVRG